MKNRIIFAVLLTIIIITGLNGTKIITAILSLNNAEQSEIPRSSVKSGAVYLSPDDISFDPMSMVNKEKVCLSATKTKNNIVYCNGNFDICDIIDSLIRNISMYSENAEYFRPAGAPAKECVYAAPNGLYYVENYKYYNRSLNIRCVDLIINGEDLNIRYIRFYDEQQRTASYEAIQQEINKLSKMSEEFYKRICYSFQSDYYSWFYGYSVQTDDFEYPNLYIDTAEAQKFNLYDYNGIHDYYIHWACQTAQNWYMNEDGSNPMILFFVTASAAEQVSFNHKEYYYDDFGRPIYDEGSYEIPLNISSAMPFIMSCNEESFLTNMEFAAFDGRIYLTTMSYYSRKTIIYNVASHEIEGYCYEYSSNDW